ncbi:MAG TPA: hypothetical protein VFV01_19680 [Spirillospora sp.]|uniref:Uncharacterized protein n=1 Tax=Actinomadura violacea TaxID=2819934 RepID=A0ABS3RHY8_9ACTN|nr:hypothetical protein [Actinomadura violacea]MBO2456346.1 hypothetical protein [Actinomadura violacea]HEU5027148.1 hypothetical protein [Spirillospora sp.]
MEPVTLAAAAVGALVPYLGQMAEGGLARLGEAASDGVSQRIAELYRTIRGRIAGARYEETILEGAEAQPENEGRRAALQNVLTELIDADPEFATRLERLVEELKAVEARHLQVADSGAVAGNDLHQTGTYVAGRDLRIGDVP